MSDMRKAAAGLLLFIAGISGASGANAQPAAGKTSCFTPPEFQNWKAPNDHTIYIRINLNRYYRLDLQGKCEALLWPDAHLITVFRGPDIVCSALDWDLKVSEGMNGIPEACIVKSMTELTPQEAAAIPKKFKP